MDLWADEVDDAEGAGDDGEGAADESSGSVPALVAPHEHDGAPPSHREVRDDMSQHDVPTDEHVERYFNRVDAEEHEEPFPDIYGEMTQYYEPQDVAGAEPAMDAQLDEYLEAPASLSGEFDTQPDGEDFSAVHEVTELPSNPCPNMAFPSVGNHVQAPEPSAEAPGSPPDLSKVVLDTEALKPPAEAPETLTAPGMEALNPSTYMEEPKPSPVLGEACTLAPEVLSIAAEAPQPPRLPSPLSMPASSGAPNSKDDQAREAPESLLSTLPGSQTRALDGEKHAQAPEPPMTAPSVPTSWAPKATFEITRASSSHKKKKKNNNAEILAKIQALQRLL